MKFQPWKALLEAAKRTERDWEAVMPFGFERRVLAQLRRRRADGTIDWKPYLLGGLVCSAVIMLLTLVFNYGILQPDALDEATITDSLIKISLN